MDYRSDLSAAQARADAAMKALSRERDARDDDAEHIAELERSLAESLTELAELREKVAADEAEDAEPALPAPSPGPELAQVSPSSEAAPSNPQVQIWPVVVAVALVGIGWMIAVSGSDTESEPVAYDQAYEPEIPELDEIRRLAGIYDDVPARETAAPADIDVSEAIVRAETWAQDYFGSDVAGAPFLVGIEATGVDDDGKAQLQYGSVSYSFVTLRPPLPIVPDSPSEAPIGARPPKKAVIDGRPCHIKVAVDEDGMRYSGELGVPSMPSGGIGDDTADMFPEMTRHRRRMEATLSMLSGICKAPAITSSCSVAQIRKKSIVQGAPAGALARVSIGADSNPECDSAQCAETPNSPCCLAKANTWRVSIVDRGETIFEAAIDDNCETP